MASGTNIAKISGFFFSARSIKKAWRGAHWPKGWPTVVARDGRIVSPLLLRILAVNVMALAILVGSMLYLGRYQEKLIASELDALRLQGQLSASALGEGAVVIDDDERNVLSPLLSRLMIRRLVEANDTRTRLFDLDYSLLADSRLLQGHSSKIQKQVLPASIAASKPFFMSRWAMSFFDFIDHIVEQQSFAPYIDDTISRKAPLEIMKKAMLGETAPQVWTLQPDGLMLSVAVPVQRYKQVLGVLVLSRPDTTINQAIRVVRLDILKVFLITLVITTLLSLYLARAIATPIRLLAKAAESLRHGQKQMVGLAGTARLLKKEAIPDFSGRHDEIGDLSVSLRDMTAALAQRIGAIENFAADVAHEIKNPLTSLRSAVETAEKVQDPAMQRRLMVVIRDDVDRLDRLISDISNASRLDAELSRDEATLVDIGQVLMTLTDFYTVSAESANGAKAKVVCHLLEPNLFVMGVEVRLVQVMQNLIGNALSFAPENTEVVITAGTSEDGVIITVDDDGLGIPENKLTTIFDRFYSERPKAEKFGTHSGLGLSISKQIVEAHQGHVWAENRMKDQGQPNGARFVVALPRAKKA